MQKLFFHALQIILPSTVWRDSELNNQCLGFEGFESNAEM